MRSVLHGRSLAGRERQRAGQGWPCRSELRRRRMTASIAAAGERRVCLSTGMCEFAPARLAREAQRSRANRMLARPSCPGAMVLATFAETKVARERQRAESEKLATPPQVRLLLLQTSP